MEVDMGDPKITLEPIVTKNRTMVRTEVKMTKDKTLKVVKNPDPEKGRGRP